MDSVCAKLSLSSPKSCTWKKSSPCNRFMNRISWEWPIMVQKIPSPARSDGQDKNLDKTNGVVKRI